MTVPYSKKKKKLLLLNDLLINGLKKYIKCNNFLVDGKLQINKRMTLQNDTKSSI